MNTTEHLEKIKAKCQQLLATAEKRTPGKWIHDACAVISRCSEHDGEARKHIDGGFYRIEVDGAPSACTYIASCAGPAEAGWRATIAVIHNALCAGHEFWELPPARQSDLKLIIAAWPEELL